MKRNAGIYFRRVYSSVIMYPGLHSHYNKSVQDNNWYDILWRKHVNIFRKTKKLSIEVNDVSAIESVFYAHVSCYKTIFCFLVESVKV